MARGDVRRRQRARVHEAVTAAEEATGLQIAVCFSRPREDLVRRQAERIFAARGLTDRPAVLVLVVPRTRRVELVTAPAARVRLSDEACIRVVDAMTDAFASDRRRHLAGGIEAGMAAIVDHATGE